jgi:hypothetical protein
VRGLADGSLPMPGDRDDGAQGATTKLGLSAEVPELAACRAPPGGGAGEGGDDGVAE